MIGEKLKELRLEKKLTQMQLAEKMNCSQKNISAYELDQIELSASVIIRYCRIFQVSADYILGLEDETGAKTYK